MVYEEFLDAVKQRMELALGKGYALMLRKVPKNNGLVLDGLCITRGNAHIAPAIYLNPCYQQYQEGRALDDIVEELLTLYRQNDTPPPLNYEMLSDYGKMSPSIACKLVHAESNQSLLDQVPHISWMDLALVFYLCIHEDDSGLMTAMVHKTHLDIWNISLDELKGTALSNTPRLFPPVITSMACIIEELTTELKEENKKPGAQEPGARSNATRNLLPDGDHDIYADTPLSPIEDSSPFYVLSNRSGINGAACILYRDVLKNFADSMEKDLIILPSSIHEVLLLPDDGDISYEEMSRLVTHINQSEVPKEDRLSNQVYLYSRETDRITMASHSLTPIC